MADDPINPYNRCKSLVVHWTRHYLSSPTDYWLIRCDVGQMVTIDDLPDDALLVIFDLYVVEHKGLPDIIDFIIGIGSCRKEIESWQPLVHVCRRWRGLVFASPQRLKLRLCTSARMSLNVWPALPLLIRGGGPVDNVIAELEHSDRIHQIEIFLNRYTTREVEKLWTGMQVQFPKLTVLHLGHKDA